MTGFWDSVDHKQLFAAITDAVMKIGLKAPPGFWEGRTPASHVEMMKRVKIAAKKWDKRVAIAAAARKAAAS